MTREAFKKHVEESIEELIKWPEQRTGKPLPRSYCFGYINPNRPMVEQQDVIEHITREVYVDAEHIRPCFDLILGDILDDGRLLICGYRANYPPTVWQTSWCGSNRPGPFNLMYSQNFLKKVGLA